MQKILFIINPISGVKKKLNVPDLIKKHFAAAQYEIQFTQHKGHATELASKAVKEKYNIVVAVGGDGTINECAQSLLHTEVTLGIIPLGSGNGLARHLKIPLQVEKGLELIKNFNTTKIDAAFLNNKLFLSNAGFGFIADVAEAFDKRKTYRGFTGYALQTTKLFFGYKPKKFIIKTDKVRLEGKFFAINICNSNQFGYEAKVSPASDLSDGLLDVVIMKKSKVYDYIYIMYHLFFGNVLKNKSVIHFTTTKIEIESSNNIIAQTDGEPVEVGEVSEVRIDKLALKIIIP